MAGRRQSGSVCPRCQPGSGDSWSVAEPSLVCLLENLALHLGLQRLDLQTQMSRLSSWRPLGQCTRTDSFGRSASSSSNSSGMKSYLQREGLGLWRPEIGDPALGRCGIRAPREESQKKSGSVPGRPERGGWG